ncbi:MAG TPA: nitrous oxide reductase family maturation protein NosD [Phycisphaerales bacterium]|nr:nitrous oxide reductase family maturation protein NosD [Phycisphaerales bacterium]
MRRGVVAILFVLLGAAAPLAARPMSDVEALIDAAAPGGVVLIPTGVYEGNLVIRKPVVLDGQGEAVLDGLERGTVVEVLAEGVTIRGCTIRGSGENVTAEPAGIRVLAGHAVIESNTIEDTLFGIDLRQASDSVVRGNSIACKKFDPARRGDGLRLWWSHNCTVEGNTVLSSRDMVFWYSENLHITRNTVKDSRYGLHFMYSHDTVLEGNELTGNSVGVYLMYSNRITLINNRMLSHRGASGYGIGLKDCDDIVVRGNALLANRVGMYIDNSPSSIGATGIVEQNMIAFNEVGLLATPNTHENVFTRNAFMENEEPAESNGRGRLTGNSFSRDGFGNYWSDYTGFDLDGDGIGDVAYEPRSLFHEMLAVEPNLRLFVHSPAQQAIEFTARALPELQPESVLVDPAPLAGPPEIKLALPPADGAAPVMASLAAGLLLASGGLTVVFGRSPGIPAAPGGRE